MKDLMAVESIETMCSTEIAELTGKDHKNVMRDIDNMLESLEISQLKNEQSTYKLRGKEYRCYKLNKELTLTLVSGYNVKLRNAIVKRWQELEELQPSMPKTYLEALEILIEKEKALQVAVATKAEIGNRREATAMNTASQKVKENKKLVKALERHDCKTMTELLKGIDISSRAANTKLEAMGYLFTENVNGKKRKRLTKKGETIAKEFPGSKFVQIGILPSCEEQVLEIINVQ